MDYSYLLKENTLIIEKMLDYGFKFESGKYFLDRPVHNGDFIAKFTLSESDFSVALYDVDFGDEYAPYNIESLQGAFVVGVRNEVEKIISDIISKCFKPSNVRKEVVDYIKSKYDISPEFPWGELPNHCIFRNKKNQKWFAIIMNVNISHITLIGDHMVNVMNVKLTPAEIPDLIDNKNIFHAYHMNKTHWLTILLNTDIPFEKITDLIDRSYNLVSSK